MTISIITVTYNAAGVIGSTLDSVGSQTYGDIEHLIIDGASTDGTLDAVYKYRDAARYAVGVFSEPDHGIYDAMNKGMARATGDYVVFLNAGDTFHAADTLQTIADTAMQWRDAAKGFPAVVYGDTAVVDSDHKFMHLRKHRPPRQLSWRSFRQGMLVCHQAFYARTDIAKATAYDLKYRYSADVDWCIRVMKEAERQNLPLVDTHAIIANFEHGGNTTQHHTESLRERFAVMRRHYGLPTTLAMHAWFVVRAVIRR